VANLISGETLRVLLVSRQEAVRDEVGEVLAGRAGEHRLYWVSQPDLAGVRAQDLLPHVVVVDDDLGGANPVTLISQLSVRLPTAALLVLVGADGVAVARQAVLSGARGFVMKPIQPEEFIAGLRQMLASRAAPPALEPSQGSNGRIVVFCAPKGGTGRTTMAINTALCLHKETREPVVLVDADFAAPALDVALNLDPSRNIIDLLPQMGRLDADLVSSVLADHASGVQALLAPPPADLTHPISLPQVQQVLVWLKRMYPWVIVDLGLPLDETAFAFLDGADRIVMSLLPEMVGLRNTRLMLDQLHARGYPPEKVWLVLNRATLRGGVPVPDIEARLHVSVRRTIPDDQSLATYSVNRGVPLVMSHGGSALAKAFRVLAAELAYDVGSAQAPAESDHGGTGLLGWLRPRSSAARA
jgi:pilus assembly protein CpaE